MNEKQINQLNNAKNYAQLKKGYCLTTNYKNNTTKLEWKCEHNHIWESTYKTVVQKESWCPECSKIAQSERQKNKNGLEEAQLYASSRGGECLSTEYINARTKLLWKCNNKKHNSWEAIPSQVVRLKTWCPQCHSDMVSIKKTNLNGLEIAKNFAQSKNGECLSEDYIAANKKLKWKCDNNHIWESSFSNVVSNRTWCPQCSTFYRKEHIVRDLLEYLLNTKFPKKKPKWNINTKTNKLLELDGYSEELSIAFEFQGLHHYKTGVFYKNEDDLVYIKYKDKIKKQNCSNNNVKLLVIDDKFKITEKEKILSYILELLNNLSIRVVKLITNKKLNELFNKTTSIQKEFILKAKEYAHAKGGDCLSKEYINSESKLLWKCNEKKHQPWEATFTHIFSTGTWCPRCKGKFSKEEQLSRAKEYAISKGGECLSTVFLTVNDKLQWKCSKLEHPIWESDFSHVVNRKRWCPECSKEKISQKNKNINGLLKAKEHAISRGGECLSNEYVNNHTKMKWKCHNENHKQWEAHYSNVVTCNKWCPECAKEKRKK